MTIIALDEDHFTITEPITPVLERKLVRASEGKYRLGDIARQGEGRGKVIAIMSYALKDRGSERKYLCRRIR